MLTQWEGNALPAYKEILYKSSFANPANKETGLESSICKSCRKIFSKVPSANLC